MTTADPELARLVDEARAGERRGLEELAARARLRELRASPDAGDERLVQLGVRIPAALRDAVREAARLAGTSTQDWVARALTDAIVQVSDPSARVAAQLADDIRTRWRVALTDEAYAAHVASLSDADLANV